MREHLALREQAEREDRIRRWWQDSEAPDRHQDAINLRTTATGEWANTYREISGRLGDGFLVALLGPRGTGKTQMATCLIRDACEQDRSARYIKAADLFDELRVAMRDGHEMQTKRRFCRYGLLVIDEAHEGCGSDFERRSLINVIDHRYDGMRDTLLLSNQDKDAFVESIGSSIASRILETGKAIVCDWPSFRRNDG